MIILATMIPPVKPLKMTIPGGAIVLVQRVGVDFVEHALLHADFEIFQDHLCTPGARKGHERAREEGGREGGAR